MYRWKGLENTFPTVYYTPENFLKLHLKNKKKNCSRLVIANQGGQNNRSGNFSNTFYQRIELYC
jgi:hypothetical protein